VAARKGANGSRSRITTVRASGASTAASASSAPRRGEASAGSSTAASAARTGVPSAKRKSSRRWKTTVRASGCSQEAASSGRRPPAPSARVSAAWRRSPSRLELASSPQRGSRLWGSVASATTSPRCGGAWPRQPLPAHSRAHVVAHAAAIWLTLFRALCYCDFRARTESGRMTGRGSMRRIRSFLAALLFASAAGAAGAEALQRDDFPRPPSLESQIRFWRAIFTEYSKHQIVLHDTVDLDKIYKVLDFRAEAEGGMSPVLLERLEREETEAEL